MIRMMTMSMAEEMNTGGERERDGGRGIGREGGKDTSPCVFLVPYAALCNRPHDFRRILKLSSRNTQMTTCELAKPPPTA